MAHGGSLSLRPAVLAALCWLLAQAAAGGPAPRPSPQPPLARRPVPAGSPPPLSPPPPLPPRPPRPPPSPPVSLAEAAWHLWVKHLHIITRYSTPPTTDQSSAVAKLLPQTYWYGLLASDDVPGNMAATDAADIWANMVLQYDPLWLRPQRALLADSLAMMQQEAEAAAMVPAEALAALRRAVNRNSLDPGFNRWVRYNPNNEFLPGYSPAWDFAAPRFATQTQRAKERERNATAWALNFKVTAAKLARSRAVSWEQYTLDGTAALVPPPGVRPDDPQAWPAQHFVDLTASDLGKTTRFDLASLSLSISLVAKGVFAGRLGPSRSKWLLPAFGGPFPATPAAQRVATSYFAAPDGQAVAVPQAVVAVYSPRITVALQPAAYANFKQRWQNVTPGGTRRLDAIAWSVLKGEPSTGTVQLDDATSSFTVTPRPGRWYRVAQVQRVLAPGVYLKSLRSR